jgi:heat shock protein 1/8
MVSDAERYKAEDEAATNRITAKNGLESYACKFFGFAKLQRSSTDFAVFADNLRNTLEGEMKDKFDAGDRETLNKAVSEAISWLDASAEASEEEYKERQKELEGVANPIMQKLYASAGAAGGAPGGFPGAPGGAPGGFPGAGADEPNIGTSLISFPRHRLLTFRSNRGSRLNRLSQKQL